MNRALARSATVVLSACLCGVRAQDPTSIVALKSVKLEKGEYRLSSALKDTGVRRVEKKAYAANIDERRFLFFDLDRDRELTQADGMGLEGLPFIVPLPEELLLASGQYSYRFEGLSRLVLRRSELGLDAELFPTAIALTEVRIRAGLVPLVADAEASVHSRAHLDYLHQNRIVRNRMISLEAHNERRGKPGYSVEGARAGKMGLLGAARSLTEDVMAWFSTTFHGVKLLDPRLRRVGIARRHELSLVYPLFDGPALENFAVQPADGARHVPPNFSRGGEVPSPIPDRQLGAGTGFPLIVYLPAKMASREVTQFELRDSDGQVVRGYASSPTKPANPKVFPRNMGAAFFIPYTRLEDGTTYSATFQMEGMAEPLEWSFETWKWEPKDR